MSERVESAANPLLLWAGILLGPFAWALDQGLSYMLTQHACSTGHHYVLHVISGVCLLIAISGALIARQQLALVPDGDENGGSPRDRAWFMAHIGIALSLGMALIIIAFMVPKLVFSPCD